MKSEGGLRSPGVKITCYSLLLLGCEKRLSFDWFFILTCLSLNSSKTFFSVVLQSENSSDCEKPDRSDSRSIDRRPHVFRRVGECSQ